MQIQFRYQRIPFNPVWPNAWRGQIAFRLYAFGTTLRLQWHFRPFEWFRYSTYHAGNGRHMRHLYLFRHLGLSYLPGNVPII